MEDDRQLNLTGVERTAPCAINVGWLGGLVFLLLDGAAPKFQRQRLALRPGAVDRGSRGVDLALISAAHGRDRKLQFGIHHRDRIYGYAVGSLIDAVQRRL